MNKSIKLSVLMIFVSYLALAQVGIGTTTPDASSALDITATDKGFLMPRMTTVQRTAIASPVMGLLVYDTDTKSIWSFDGTVWVLSSGGKFVDGATPDIAYYDGKVGIGKNNFSDAHKLWVEGTKTNDDTNTPAKVVGTYEGTGTSIATFGLAAIAQNNSSATADFTIAVRPIANNLQANGTVNNAVGTWPEVNNNGNMGYAAGVISSINNNGTLTTVESIATSVFNASGQQLNSATLGYFSLNNNGTMDTASGLYIEDIGTGSVTDSYAIYIQNNFNKGTNNNYAIYSATDADSHFNGNIGVGVENPLQKVHISGAMRLEPLAVAPAGALGDLYVNTDGKLYFHNGTIWKEVQLVP